MNRPEDAPIGLIPVDAIYSPVRRVAYRVEPTRVGQVTDYDKLVLNVETDGTVAPEDAVALAARILQDQLQLFINFDEPRERKVEEERDDLPFNRNLLRKVDEKRRPAEADAPSKREGRNPHGKALRPSSMMS